MNPLFKTAVAILLSGSFAGADDRVPPGREILTLLQPGHPRLILTEDRLDELRRLAETDPLLAQAVKKAMGHAESLRNYVPPPRESIGGEMLPVSSTCVNNLYALGLAWRWTGETRYAESVKQILLTVCAYEDWNPAHFLDTAEMAYAVGIGYDWIYDTLTEEERRVVREGLIRNGLAPARDIYRSRDNLSWWVRSEYNWNQVCNGGLIVAALAVADEEPELSAEILQSALASLPKALGSYPPDGAWGEGPSYWEYATGYTVYALAALESGLGTAFGLSRRSGLAETGWFPRYMSSPRGLYFNFADCNPRPGGDMGYVFWLAQKANDPALAQWAARQMETAAASPRAVLWYWNPPGENAPELSRDKWFRGRTEVAVFRSRWDDPDAIFVGVKGGYNRVNHAHLDLGSFVLEAMGVRWACDLGKDNYGLPNYFNPKRFDYYRIGSLSHNVPLLDYSNQDLEGTARVVSFESRPEAGLVVLDLTDAYRGKARGFRRGVSLLDERRAVLVQDEFFPAVRCDFTWGMTTAAEIELQEAGRLAVLRQGGRTLYVRLLSPSSGGFVVKSARQLPPEAANTGYSRLEVEFKEVYSPLRTAVLFSPVGPEGTFTPAAEITPLGKWGKGTAAPQAEEQAHDGE